MQNAPIIDVSAAERGCGKLKKGGLYLGASMSASGSLLTLVPLLPAAEFEVAPRKIIKMSTAELAGQMRFQKRIWGGAVFCGGLRFPIE